MISKAQIKHIRLLHQKKYREQEGLFIAEGPKVVSDLLASKFRAKEVYAVQEFLNNAAISRISGLKPNEVTQKELESISALSAPNQVLAVFEIKAKEPDMKVLAQELVLVLDDIRDPGNLGTIIRIADWFGIGQIICSESCVDVFNPKVIQATMGSIARVDVCYRDLDLLLKEFHPVYGAVLGGDNIYTRKLTGKGAILIGNESNGISEKLRKHITHKISIPKFSPGADSLNAAVAAAIICSEFKRTV